MGTAETEAQPAPPGYYCPGCGNRYFGPGTCANGHEPLDLVADPAMAGGTEAEPETAAPAAAEPAVEAAAGTNDGGEAEAPPASAPVETPPVVEAASAEPAAAEEDSAPEAEAAPVEEQPAAPEPDMTASALDQVKAHLKSAFDILAGL